MVKLQVGYVLLLLIVTLWTHTTAYTYPSRSPYVRSCHHAVSSNGIKHGTRLRAADKTLVIWDCDGVLVDSEALLKQGEVETLSRLGFSLTVDDCVRLFSGVSIDEAENNFFNEYKVRLPEHFFKEQIEGSMDLFRSRLQPLMVNTVARLHRGGAMQCIASGSPRPRVDLCVQVAGMDPFFTPDRVFTRELVPRGKPAPDLFLYTANKMGHSTDRCIVVEDSRSGIEAAIAANMEVLAYLGGGHAKAQWYVDAIRSYGVPIVFSEEDVFDYVDSRLIK